MKLNNSLKFTQYQKQNFVTVFMVPQTDFYRVTEGISGRFGGRYTDFGHIEFGSPK